MNSQLMRPPVGFVFMFGLLYSSLIATPCIAAEPARGIAVTPVGAVAGPTIAGDYHALIIGIDDYANWPKLQNAVHDARGVAETLRGYYGFKSSNVVELSDAQATQDAIIEAFRAYASGQRPLKPADNLLIFFSGHGNFDKVDQLGYWIPVDAREGKPGGYISNDCILTGTEVEI